MRLVPVLAHPGLGQQRHIQPGHARRQFRQLDVHQFQLGFRHLEHQFIVHLHDHARGQPVAFNPTLHRDHGQLDKVRRRALHRRIDRRTFGAGAASYFAPNPAPIVTPEDLQAHRCIGYRASGSRTLYKWEFERDTRMVNMATTGLLVLDNHTLPNMAALSGAGLAYAIEEAVPDT